VAPGIGCSRWVPDWVRAADRDSGWAADTRHNRSRAAPGIAADRELDKAADILAEVAGPTVAVLEVDRPGQEQGRERDVMCAGAGQRPESGAGQSTG
jgi:hypothetical protein